MFDPNQEQINQPNEERIAFNNEPIITSDGKNHVVETNLNSSDKEAINNISNEPLDPLQLNNEQSVKPVEQPIINESDQFVVKDQTFGVNNDVRQQESAETSEPSARFSKKRLLVIIVIVCSALLTSGGLLFAVELFFNVKIPFISKIWRRDAEISENFTRNKDQAEEVIAKESPEEIMQKMFSSFRNIKTSQEKLDIKIVKKNEEREDPFLTILLYGRRDFNNIEKPNLDYTFALNQPDVNIDLSLAFKYINETAYIKLMKDAFPFFDLSGMKNQWFYLGKQERTNLMQNSNNVFTLKLSKEDWDDFFVFFNEVKLFKTIQPLSDGVIEYAPAFHYSATLNTQSINEFIIKLENFLQNKFNEQNLQIEFPRKKIDEIKNLLDKMKDAPIEIWIEKESYFFRKALIDHFEIDTIQSGGASKTDLSLFIEVNRVNEPIYIESSEGGASLEQVTQNLFLKWFNKNSLSNDDDDDDDDDGLTNKEELLYGTDYLNPDTDGDGYIDGDEVKNGYNPNGAGRL